MGPPDHHSQEQPSGFEAVLSTLLKAALAYPPLVGLVVLILLLSGLVSDAILESGAATSTALVVAVLLILVPPALYALSPTRHIEYTDGMQETIESEVPPKEAGK